MRLIGVGSSCHGMPEEVLAGSHLQGASVPDPTSCPLQFIRLRWNSPREEGSR